MSQSLQAIGTRVVIRAEAFEEYAGKLILPDFGNTAKPDKGVVVSAGEGRYDGAGNLRPLSVAPGDRVIFSKYAGNEIKWQGETLYVVNEDSIYAKVPAPE